MKKESNSAGMTISLTGKTIKGITNVRSERAGDFCEFYF